MFVSRSGRAKCEEPEILELIVEFVEGGVSLFPAGIPFGEQIWSESAEAEEVVTTVLYHIDGKVVSGEDLEVGSIGIA